MAKSSARRWPAASSAADDLVAGRPCARRGRSGRCACGRRTRTSPLERLAVRRGRRASDAGRTGWPLTGTADRAYRWAGRLAGAARPRTRRAGGRGRGGCGSSRSRAAHPSAARSGRPSARPSRRARRPRAGARAACAARRAPSRLRLRARRRGRPSSSRARSGATTTFSRSEARPAACPSRHRSSGAAAGHEPQVGAELAAARVELLRVAPDAQEDVLDDILGRGALPSTRRRRGRRRARARRRRARRRRGR